MKKYNDFIIDLETLGSTADSIVVDISVLVFDPDPNKMETIDELIAKGKRWKLSIDSQKAKRTYNPKTVKWWKEQSAEARKNLAPLPNDYTVATAIPEILAFLKDNGIDSWKSQGWCRGQSFDFPIFVNMIAESIGSWDTEAYEPVKFWAQRDIRTAIECLLMSRGTAITPLRKGVLNGFVAHDSVHDCAKDVIMLKMAQRYALGIEAFPEEDDIDPDTVKKRKKF